MGKKAATPLDIKTIDELEEHLHQHHAAYMLFGNKMYYLTDVGENYWRAQDTAVRNHKNHFVDCSEIVPTLNEFLSLPFLSGQTISDVIGDATFYASVLGEKDA